MANYISSNSNRFYAAVESAYGQAGSVTSSNRFPAVRLAVQQGLEQGKRHDKTGSRTFLGVPANTRRLTAVEVRTYLTSWSTPGQGNYGPLFQAALGATPSFNSGITVAASITSTTIQTANPHGLATGSGVSYGNDIRFVTAVNDATTFTINAPFTAVPSAGALLAPTVTYKLASKLPSLTLYDYWDPATAVQRAAVGVGISQFAISINGDFHEFLFRGPAADVVD